MSQHIGIVACSYEGAALCYRTICNEGSKYLGRHAHPEVSLHTHPLSEYMKCINKDDWDGVANLMISSANKLCNIGANILISPDNTIHQAFALVRKGISTPWLHIAEEVTLKAVKESYKKVGILGTKFLMEGPVYPEQMEKYSLNYEIPTEEQRNKINQIIFDELVYGIFKEDSKNYLLRVIDELKYKGCDSVVLGCTEIPLIVLPTESSLPTLDSTRIIARSALKFAIGLSQS